MRKRRRSSGITRAEAGAQARRRRAMAHIERVRDRRQRRTLSLGRLMTVVAAVSVAAGLLAGTTGLFATPVARVWVAGARWVPTTEVARTAGVPRGTAPEAIDAAGVAEELAEHAWIASARVLLLPSGDLLLGVSERQPAVLLDGDTPWAVDAAGVPFAPAPAGGIEELIVVTTVALPEPGQPDADLGRAGALARRLDGLGLPAPDSVAIAAPDDPEGLSLVLPGVQARVVLGREDLDARLGDLARLLDSGLSELEGAKRIDLRFEDQAVLDMDPSLEGAEQAAESRGDAAPSNSRRPG